MVENKKSNNKNLEKMKPEKQYSLRGLMKEITGLTPLDDSFSAEYATLRRIVKALQKSQRNENGIEKIPDSMKDSFVEITKKIYEELRYDQSGDFNDLFNRMKKNEVVKEEEFNTLIDWFKEAMSKNPENERHKEALELIEIEDNFISLVDEVTDIINKDMKKLIGMANYITRTKRTEELLFLVKNHEDIVEWRTHLQEDYQRDNLMREMIMIAEDKKMDVHKVLEGKDPELLQKVMNEMIKRDVEKMLEQDKKRTDSN